MKSSTRSLKVLYLSVFLDLLAVGIVIPLFATVYKTVKMDAITYGFIGSCYGIAQFVSNPVLGRLSDIHGRKKVLLLSFIGSALSYLMLGFATNVWILFLSRILVGMVKQTMTLSQAIITDLTSEAQRVEGLGNVMTAVSLGFVVGPAVGSYLQSKMGVFFPSLLCFSLFCMDFLLVSFLLPNDTPKPDPTSQQLPSLPHPSLGMFILQHLKSISKVVWSPLVGGLLLFRFVFILLSSIIQSNFTVIIMEVFGLDPVYVGYILSYRGVVGVVSSALVGILNKKFGRSLIVHVSIIGLILVDLLSITAMTSLEGWILLIPFESVCHSLLTTINTAMYSSAFPKEKIGFAMGVSGSVESVARIIAPLLSGVIYHYTTFVGIRLSTSLLAVLCMFLWRYMIVQDTVIVVSEEKGK